MKAGSIYCYSLNREKVNSVADNLITSSPEDVVQLLHSIGLHEEEQECLLTIILNSRNKVVGYYHVTRGLVNQAHGHAREIFRYSVICNACSIIMAHNHPSGDPTPSMQDITLTGEIKEAGRILGIELIDHVIIGGDDYFSFTEEGMMKDKTNNKSRIPGQGEKEK